MTINISRVHGYQHFTSAIPNDPRQPTGELMTDGKIQVGNNIYILVTGEAHPMFQIHTPLVSILTWEAEEKHGNSNCSVV